MHKCREWQSFTRVSGMKTGEVIPFWHKMSLALNTESKAQFNFELNIDSYVAGTSHIKDESVFDDIREGDKLILQREPDNRFNENAILVLNSKSQKLGYIPEKDNIVFARLMDAGKYLTAKIEDISFKGSFRQISINIYLVDF